MAAKQKSAEELQGLGAGTASSSSVLQQSNLGDFSHTDDELWKSNPDEGRDSRKHVMTEKLREYLKICEYVKLTKECLDRVQAMSSPKFNNEQCIYLLEKLKTTFERAMILVVGCQFQPMRMLLNIDVERWAHAFNLLAVLGKQVENFFQECCKDAWIQSAMTLAHVEEYVSSIGFNLELFKSAYSMEGDVTQTLTMEEVAKLNANEVEIVKKMDLIDAMTLQKKFGVLQTLDAEDRNLATYLMSKSIGGTTNSILDGHISKLHPWVTNVGRKEEQIGRGAFATVYKVMWFGILAAKKTSYGPIMDDVMRDFMREVDILSQLHHPNIISIFCYDMNKKECSIVMELMDGNLMDLLQTRRGESCEFLPFSNLQELGLMLQVGEAIEYLHRKKIVHRNLKSPSILVKVVKVLDMEDEILTLKVTNFGLSTRKESSMSHSSMSYNVGSTRWMPPELIKERNYEESHERSRMLLKYNFKGDIYNLGMVFMEIKTGEVPFREIGAERIVKRMILKGERPKLPRHCSPVLAKLIQRCWSQNPKERPCISDVCLELKYLKYSLLTNPIGVSIAMSGKALQELQVTQAGASSSTYVPQASLSQPNLVAIAHTAHELPKRNPSEEQDPSFNGVSMAVNGKVVVESQVAGASSSTSVQQASLPQPNLEPISQSDYEGQDPNFNGVSMAVKGKAVVEPQVAEVGTSSRASVQEALLPEPIIDSEPTPHTDHELPKRNPLEGQDRKEAIMNKLMEQYELTKSCVEGILKRVFDRQHLLKFNIEQCRYLVEKLVATCESARMFMEIFRDQPLKKKSVMEMERRAETFRFLLMLGTQVEVFVQECSKNAWIRAAVALVNVKEYVSTVGFNLEVCKVVLCKQEGGSYTLETLSKLNAIEVESVNKKAITDAKTLRKAIEEWNTEDAHKDAQEAELGNYLMFKLGGEAGNPRILHLQWHQDRSIAMSKFLKWVKNVTDRTEQIGAGVSARVYKKTWCGVPAAMKTFEGASNPIFLREVQILSQLHHPHITSIFCCTKDNIDCSFVMELMDESLFNMLRSRRREDGKFHPFSLLDSINLMLQVGSGVQYLHDCKKIAHRDLKSANILVKKVEALGSKIVYFQVKLVDFGWSKTKETSTTSSNMSYNVGTSKWMAPEVMKESSSQLAKFNKFKGDIYKADIYSFGMVCYEILSGEVPFLEWNQVIREGVSDGSIRPRLPDYIYCIPQFGKLIKRCWSHSPSERPSMKEVCLELKYFIYSILTSGKIQESPHLCVERSFTLEEHKAHEDCRCVGNILQLFKFRSS